MDAPPTPEEALRYHADLRGKLRISLKKPLRSRADLALSYTPGVAAPCREIAKHPERVFEYTGRGNNIAIVTDGSAVLGLGDIGPEAALPVMEGKAALMKEFAGIDAYPLCLALKRNASGASDSASGLKVQDFVDVVRALEPSFGGVLLEDIAAPRCFEVEETLKRELSIPVFHDDQHGTAVVVLAGLMNALKVTGRVGCFDTCRRVTLSSPEPAEGHIEVSGGATQHDNAQQRATMKIVISGAGAAGTAIARMLLSQGFANILVCDRKGVISRKRSDLNEYKTFLAATTNPENAEGTLADALRGADVFIGVSAQGLLTENMVRTMRPSPIVFALANPEPEILPDAAKRGGAAVIATGRSDFPNQVNNLLAFPGIFRGALDVRAKSITEDMKLAAARALASYIKEPTAEQILPDPLDRGVVKAVAEAVKNASSSRQAQAIGRRR